MYNKAATRLKKQMRKYRIRREIEYIIRDIQALSVKYHEKFFKNKELYINQCDYSINGNNIWEYHIDDLQFVFTDSNSFFELYKCEPSLRQFILEINSDIVRSQLISLINEIDHSSGQFGLINSLSGM